MWTRCWSGFTYGQNTLFRSWRSFLRCRCTGAAAPRIAVALLLEPGVVDHQHSARVAETLGHLPPQRAPYLVGSPFDVVEQPLHPVRPRVPVELRQ